MSISDEEKRQIMNELARGNPEMQAQEPSQHPAPDEENFDPQDYQNFDDFAQRSSQAKQGQLFNQPFNSQQNELATPDSLKERINTDLNQAKEVGQLNPNEFEKLSLLQCFRWLEFQSQ